MHALLRILYYLLYHSLAWSYDLVAGIVSFGRWNQWVNRILPLIRGKRILELGFGPGHLQVELNRSGYAVYGLDESRQMIRQTTRRLSKNHYPTNLVRGLTQHLPFDSSFDTIIATFPSNYIFDQSTVEEIHAALVPGGRIIILLSVIFSQHKLPEKLVNSLSKFSHRKKMPGRKDRIEELYQRFIEEGFKMDIVDIPDGHVLLQILVGEKP